MTRRSCCTRGARLRAGFTTAAAGIAAAVFLAGPPAAAEPKSRRIVDGEAARQIMLRHGGEAFRPEVATSRSGAGLTQQKGADGTVSVDLQGRFQHVHYAVPDGSGGFTTGCTDDAAVLRQATGGEGK